MNDLEQARKEKVTTEHDVIDDAIRDRGERCTVFSIPVGVLCRPPENKLKNIKSKDYLGKVKLVVGSNIDDVYIVFSGVTKLNRKSGPNKNFPLESNSNTSPTADPLGALKQRLTAFILRIGSAKLSPSLEPSKPISDVPGTQTDDLTEVPDGERGREYPSRASVASLEISKTSWTTSRLSIVPYHTTIPGSDSQAHSRQGLVGRLTSLFSVARYKRKRLCNLIH